jgi:hypothetical protein
MADAEETGKNCGFEPAHHLRGMPDTRLLIMVRILTTLPNVRKKRTVWGPHPPGEDQAPR